jgi:hypothetical protein
MDPITVILSLSTPPVMQLLEPLWRLFFVQAATRASRFMTGSVRTRARSQQKAQRRSVISTKAWHCFMVSITGARSAHSRKRRGSIRNVPWHIGALP